MIIDTARLATDAGYWDEVDDTNGKATHYCTQGGGFCNPDYTRHCGIPRPQSEWADGLPPVGAECEYKTLDGEWWPVVITAVGKSHVLFLSYGVEICREIKSVQFRPIKTKAQLQREELADFLHYAQETKKLGDGMSPTEAQADAILSRYTLEPKQ